MEQDKICLKTVLFFLVNMFLIWGLGKLSTIMETYINA